MLKKIFLILVLCLLLVSCNSSSSKYVGKGGMDVKIDSDALRQDFYEDTDAYLTLNFENDGAFDINDAKIVVSSDIGVN